MRENKGSSLQGLSKEAFIFLLFVALTVVMTWPLAVNMTRSVPGDTGDPLLNTWILAWDAHKILELDFRGFFDANIFFPYKNTLAYSEHLMGSAIFALPIIAFFKNPVFAYNVIFLAGILFSAVGMYLLALYLTESRLGAFIAGMVFAFFPWRLGGELGHLQTQTAQWIPLTFLFLHKFLDSGKRTHLLLFTLFFILQFLSNGYYALFLSVFIGIVIAMEASKRGGKDRAFLANIGVFFVLSAIFIIPFFYPYIRVKHEMGFTRSFNEIKSFSADVLSHVTANPSNIWGGITGYYRRPGEYLFFGVTTIIVLFFNLVFRPTKERTRREEAPSVKGRLSGILSWFMGVAIALFAAEAAVILLAGEIDARFLGMRLRAASAYKPVTLVLVVLFFRLLLEERFRVAMKRIFYGVRDSRKLFYVFVFVSSMLFTLGPVVSLNGKEMVYGPYFVLYKVFPGFSGLRVPARFIIMAALGAGALSAWGMAGVLGRIKRGSLKIVFTILISFFFLLESLQAPLPVPTVPVGEEIPEVYRWLGGQEGDFAILELPLPERAEETYLETKYIYFSISHWKRLVNGYSGYFPRTYDYLYREGLRDFPSEPSVELIRGLGIRYLVIHSGLYGNEKFQAIKSGLGARAQVLSLVKEFGPDQVYEVRGQGADNP